MVAVAISAMFGLLREVVIAAEFGTSGDTDAYFFAFDLIARFPELLSAAVAGALIPVYVRAKADGSADRLAGTAMTTYGALLVGLAVITAVAAPLVVAVAGSGFDEAVGATAVVIIRILSPATALIGVWGILKLLLTAEDRFFVSTISQVFLSLGVIAATLLLAPSLGVESVALGVLGASVAQVLWTGYWVRRAGEAVQSAEMPGRSCATSAGG